VWRSKELTTILIFAHGLNAELNPICHLLPLLGAHGIFHISELRVKLKNEASFPHHEPAKTIQNIKDLGTKHCNHLSELLISDSVSQLFSLNIPKE
jgi:hypothetical protein